MRIEVLTGRITPFRAQSAVDWLRFGNEMPAGSPNRRTALESILRRMPHRQIPHVPPVQRKFDDAPVLDDPAFRRVLRVQQHGRCRHFDRLGDTADRLRDILPHLCLGLNAQSAHQPGFEPLPLHADFVVA